jgi:hypothetical protein
MTINGALYFTAFLIPQNSFNSSSSLSTDEGNREREREALKNYCSKMKIRDSKNVRGRFEAISVFWGRSICPETRYVVVQNVAFAVVVVYVALVVVVVVVVVQYNAIVVFVVV